MIKSLQIVPRSDYPELCHSDCIFYIYKRYWSACYVIIIKTIHFTYKIRPFGLLRSYTSIVDKKALLFQVSVLQVILRLGVWGNRVVKRVMKVERCFQNRHISTRLHGVKFCYEHLYLDGIK